MTQLVMPIVCLYILLALSVARPSPSYGQMPIVGEFEALVNSAFNRTGTITFAVSDSLLIGTICTLDIDSEQGIVITDKVGNQAILFDGNGNLVALLDARLCNPGVRFYPTGARIRSESTVLVIGTSPWGFLFEKDGACKGPLAQHFSSFAQDKLVLDGRNAMLGFFDTGAGQVLRFMDSAGRTTNEVNLPPSPAPGVDYRWAGGGLAKTESPIYYATPSSSALTQLDLEAARSGNSNPAIPSSARSPGICRIRLTHIL
ncbi:MAG: hypothetical protein OXM02_11215 [Bacteroidota bacterium]|nr:hypothetical protein [Bacteroidota bacterium]MDE2835072.1 hypothetical protein [Bacteroidota bacterium]